MQNQLCNDKDLHNFKTRKVKVHSKRVNINLKYASLHIGVAFLNDIDYDIKDDVSFDIFKKDI